jgi:GTP cyclohydrolase IA
MGYRKHYTLGGMTMDLKVLKQSTPISFEKPTQEDAEEAVRTLLAWAGDNPKREGLIDTPRRVTKAYKEYFIGYTQDPAEILDRVFEQVSGYDDMVLLRDISFTSHCEHHIAPFFGRAHVAYLPNGGVVGISKIARVVDTFAKRLQTQETMTAQIAEAILENLGCLGVAVMLEAVHTCMSMRGVEKSGVATVTTQFNGQFKTNSVLQARFIEQVRAPRNAFTI